MPHRSIFLTPIVPAIRPVHTLSPIAIAIALAIASFSSAAQDAAPQVLAPVTVSATRTQAAPKDVPASINVIDGESMRDGKLGVNLSESLGNVPGLFARDRQNYAQDLQLSVRGFGARSTFGIRGVRVYVDDIPATLPDGQGQLSNIDINSIERVEILRGPYSALYGNSSGGVLQVFTEEGTGPTKISFGVAGGSNGALRLSTKASGGTDTFGYVLSASHFETDGYRDHSAARRNIGNAKLTFLPDDSSKLTLTFNSVSLPYAQDPLGLSRAQYEANPKGVDPAANNFNTRKTVEQNQGGLVYERKLDAVNSIRMLVYTGDRSTTQYQSIPVATQAGALNAGGVIDLGRNYSGTDLRWTARTSVADKPFTLVTGIAYDTLREQRYGYQNFVGSTLGVQGALRRDEINHASNFDVYTQGTLKLSSQWSVNAGVRRSNVRIDSQDKYVVGANPNDSGNADYGATLPVIGVMYAWDKDTNVYASAGKGFETPTLNELSYRPNGATGLNFGLQPAKSDNYEIGVKSRIQGLGNITAAVFRTNTESEIVTLSNVGGRSTFQNAGGTRRQGLELEWSTELARSLSLQAAYTALDAKYSNGFLSCTATPCATPTVPVQSGNKIPGVARNILNAALAYAPAQGWRGGVEARYVGRAYVNDQNSDATSGYVVANLSVGYLLPVGGWQLTSFARIDNLFDRKYAGSSILNEGNGRYFEPAPGRTWLVGLNAAYQF